METFKIFNNFHGTTKLEFVTRSKMVQGMLDYVNTSSCKISVSGNIFGREKSIRENGVGITGVGKKDSGKKISGTFLVGKNVLSGKRLRENVPESC